MKRICHSLQHICISHWATVPLITNQQNLPCSQCHNIQGDKFWLHSEWPYQYWSSSTKTGFVQCPHAKVRTFKIWGTDRSDFWDIMLCGLVQMYQHFKTACFLHSILLFPSTLKMEATNAGAIQTKYMAPHLHHSFQISEQYSERTITCPTHPLQVTTYNYFQLFLCYYTVFSADTELWNV
jgi:hypothetical protein